VAENQLVECGVTVGRARPRVDPLAAIPAEASHPVRHEPAPSLASVVDAA
jgi:hypothetical protein